MIIDIQVALPTQVTRIECFHKLMAPLPILTAIRLRKSPLFTAYPFCPNSSTLFHFASFSFLLPSLSSHFSFSVLPLLLLCPPTSPSLSSHFSFSILPLLLLCPPSAFSPPFPLPVHSSAPLHSPNTLLMASSSLLPPIIFHLLFRRFVSFG